MGKTIYFDINGLISQVDPELAFGNSGFLHAKSIFTTAGVRNHQLLFGQDHLDRLVNGAKWLFSESVGLEPTRENIKELIKKSFREIDESEAHKDLRMRLTLFQNSRKELQIIGSFSPFDFKENLIEKVQTIDLLYGSDFKREGHKVGDYRMPFYWEEKLGVKLLFCHKDGRLGEGSHANLLLRRKDGAWLTPKLDESILTGIGVRQGLVGLNLKEEPISQSDMERFCGAWFINSLRGPIPILKINEKVFNDSEKFQKDVKSIFDENSLKRGFEL